MDHMSLFRLAAAWMVGGLVAVAVVARARGGGERRSFAAGLAAGLLSTLSLVAPVAYLAVQAFLPQLMFSRIARGPERRLMLAVGGAVPTALLAALIVYPGERGLHPSEFLLPAAVPFAPFVGWWAGAAVVAGRRALWPGTGLALVLCLPLLSTGAVMAAAYLATSLVAWGAWLRARRPGRH